MNYDIYFQIALNLNMLDLVEFCRSNKELSNICSDNFFFATKASLDFGIPREQFDDFGLEENLTPMLRYIQLYTLYRGSTYGSQKFIPLEMCLYNALDQNNERLIDYFMSIVKKQGIYIDKETGLIHSIIGNNYKMFLYFTKDLYKPKEYLNNIYNISEEDKYSRLKEVRANYKVVKNAISIAKKYNRKNMYKILSLLEQNLDRIERVLYNSSCDNTECKNENLDYLMSGINFDIDLVRLLNTGNHNQ